LVRVIKQLAEGEIMRLKSELEKLSGSLTPGPNVEFQKLLLNGPVMSNKEYKNFKEIRNRTNKWRVK
jgi:hypothetical protein